MKNNRWKSFLIGAGILAVGILGFIILKALKAEPPKEEPVRHAPLVVVVTPEVREGGLAVQGNGTVQPVREVDLIAEVSGKVVYVSPAMKSGGTFRKGDVLVRIDPSDYQNAVTVAEAEVMQRKVDLMRAQEEVEIAREEWNMAQHRTDQKVPASDPEMGSLALREPQRKLAEAGLKAAQARLADAKNRLGRARIVAPFSGRVRSETVEAGQFIGAGRSVGRVYSTKAIEIIVPYPSTQAALIEGLWTGGKQKLPATITATFGEKTFTWSGHVDRTEGAIDPSTRMINVVVRVNNPYRITQKGRPPLMVGMFTTVEVQGQQQGRYLSIPREALHEGNVVWVIEEGRLSIRPVDVIQEVEGRVYVPAGHSVTASQASDGQVLAPAGLESDDQVVVSKLDVVTEGMEVRTTN